MLRIIYLTLLIGMASAIVAAVSIGRSEIAKLQVPTAAEAFAPKVPRQPETKLETALARNVGSGEIPSPLPSNQPLERIAAVPQPTPPKAQIPKFASHPTQQSLRWRLVYNAIAVSAGIMQANDLTLVLSGIDVVAENESCERPDGSSWPCGTVARTAFRNYLKGRALNCHLPDYTVTPTLVADCVVAGQDPAKWLVSQGWARASAIGTYAAEEEVAKSEGRGIYGSPPPGVHVAND